MRVLVVDDEEHLRRVMRLTLEASGYDALICSPEDLEFDGGKLYFGGVAIDVVYKRLLVNEYLPIVDEHPALLEAYRSGAICMVNSFRGKLIHKKAIFAILTDERYAQLFDEGEREAIRAHVPWTRKFRAEKTLNKDIEIDLFEWTRQNAHKLVLKPNDDYGGHGIFIGWNSSESEWDDAIKAALADGDYLVQERVSTAKEMFPMMFDDIGKWGFVEQLVDLDPLLFNGVVGSAFTRLSSNELANVTAGGGMVPTTARPRGRARFVSTHRGRVLTGGILSSFLDQARPYRADLSEDYSGAVLPANARHMICA